MQLPLARGTCRKNPTCDLSAPQRHDGLGSSVCTTPIMTTTTVNKANTVKAPEILGSTLVTASEWLTLKSVQVKKQVTWWLLFKLSPTLLAPKLSLWC